MNAPEPSPNRSAKPARLDDKFAVSDVRSKSKEGTGPCGNDICYAPVTDTRPGSLARDHESPTQIFEFTKTIFLTVK